MVGKKDWLGNELTHKSIKINRSNDYPKIKILLVHSDSKCCNEYTNQLIFEPIYCFSFVTTIIIKDRQHDHISWEFPKVITTN